MIRLENDDLRLWLEPARGVQWSALEARRGDDWLALVPDCRDDAPRPRAGQDERVPLAAANFHMIPYSNRVANARFEFEGRTHELFDPEKHAMHGVVRKRGWRVGERTRTSLECTFDSREHDGFEWPWPLTARIAHELDGTALVGTMSVTNEGGSAMPAGLGWHPYFVREVAGAAPRVRLPVASVYPDAHGTCLPDGAPVELPGALDFREARTLRPSPHIDCCLAGLDGQIGIDWPEADIGLTMSADPVCTHLVLFNPAAPHFAVEPVTNANDAFNLESRGIEAGVVTLAPGETLEATLRLDITGPGARGSA